MGRFPIFEAREIWRGSSRTLSEYLSVEYREPYRRGCRVGPVDAMTPVRGDVEPIAGAQQARVALVGEPQLGGAGEHQHQLAFRLVVPETRRARLSQRN